MRSMRNAVTRYLKYIIVGLLANGILLIIYYILTFIANFEPKSALFFASAIGLALSYVANREWTFQAPSTNGSPALRYLVGYSASFALQWLILHVGTDKFGLAHQWVVIAGLGIASICFFQLQRHWVFATSRSRNASK